MTRPDQGVEGVELFLLAHRSRIEARVEDTRNKWLVLRTAHPVTVLLHKYSSILVPGAASMKACTGRSMNTSRPPCLAVPKSTGMKSLK